MKPRDPRLNPQIGDVVGDRRVVERSKYLVVYSDGRFSLKVTLSAWRAEAKGMQVVRTAEVA